GSRRAARALRPHRRHVRRPPRARDGGGDRGRGDHRALHGGPSHRARAGGRHRAVPGVIEDAARPYPYRFEPRATALIVIDMQRDFVETSGFGAALGNDVSRLGAIVPTVRALLDWARAKPITVLHTREGHR